MCFFFSHIGLGVRYRQNLQIDWPLTLDEQVGLVGLATDMFDRLPFYVYPTTSEGVVGIRFTDGTHDLATIVRSLQFSDVSAIARTLVFQPKKRLGVMPIHNRVCKLPEKWMDFLTVHTHVSDGCEPRIAEQFVQRRIVGDKLREIFHLVLHHQADICVCFHWVHVLMHLKTGQLFVI